MLNTFLLSVLLVLGAMGSRADAGDIDLTGQWHLVGDEPEFPFMHWEADLYITQITGPGNRHALVGSFYWEGTDGDIPGMIWGWEDFEDGQFGSESYYNDSTNRIFIQGYQVRDNGSTVPGFDLVASIYEADVSADGNRLLNGSWGGPGATPGVWEAVRVVPSPGAFALIALGGAARLRRRGRAQ